MMGQFRAKLSRWERAVIWAFGVVVTLALAALGQHFFSTASRRSALLEKRDREVASLPAEEAELLELLPTWIANAAAATPEDRLAVHLRSDEAFAAAVGRSGLYFRAAVPDVATPRALAEAVRHSTRDALLLCLLDPPASDGDVDLVVASTRAPLGSAAFTQATTRVQGLAVVARGLRVLGRGWPDEVNAADSLGLRTLEYEFDDRTQTEISTAKGWARAAQVFIVLDELPDGMKAPEAASDLAASFTAPMLPSVRGKAHGVRLVIFDRTEKRAVLALRRVVDPSSMAKRTGTVDPDAAEDCRFALAARALVHAASPKVGAPSNSSAQ